MSIRSEWHSNILDDTWLMLDYVSIFGSAKNSAVVQCNYHHHTYDIWHIPHVIHCIIGYISHKYDFRCSTHNMPLQPYLFLARQPHRIFEMGATSEKGTKTHFPFINNSIEPYFSIPLPVDAISKWRVAKVDVSLRNVIGSLLLRFQLTYTIFDLNTNKNTLANKWTYCHLYTIAFVMRCRIVDELLNKYHDFGFGSISYIYIYINV